MTTRLTPVANGLGSAIRFSLDTVLDLDLSTLLPGEGWNVVELGIFLNGQGQQSFNELGLDVMSTRDNPNFLSISHYYWWQGLGLESSSDDPVGTFTVYLSNGEENISYDFPILPTRNVIELPTPHRGTAGADMMEVDLGDSEGLQGGQLVDGSGGSDVVVVRNGSAVMLGRAGNDTLQGAELNDALYGGGGRDRLLGGAGRDILYGGNGDDRLLGEAGNDTLYGGAGNDVLDGGAGDDNLYQSGMASTSRGQAGDDIIEIEVNNTYTIEGTPTHLVYGGAGDDSVIVAEWGDIDEGFRPIAGQVTVHGGAGDDYLNMGMLVGGSLFYAGAGNDSVFANHTYNQTEGPTSDLFGGEGDDVMGGSTHMRLYGGAGDDQLNGRLLLSGGAGNDTLQASESYDPEEPGVLMYGGLGDDSLRGDWLTDTLHGGEGQDSLYGQSGDDMLYGGAGNDVMEAGAGRDMLYAGDGDDDVVIGDAGSLEGTHPNEGMALLSDTVYGGAGNDTLWGDRSGHHIYGDDGDDTITVENSAFSSIGSMIYGGSGNDTIRMEGHGTVDGGEGFDVMIFDITSRNNGYPNGMTIDGFVRGEDKFDIDWGWGNARDFDNLFGTSTGNNTGIVLQGEEWLDGYLVRIVDTFNNNEILSTMVFRGITALDSTDVLDSLQV